MTMRYPHLFSRLYNTPLMLHPDKAVAIERVFQSWALGQGVMPTAEQIKSFEAEAGHMSMAAALGGSQRFADKPYQMTDAGIAVIPVMGTLVQRASGMDAMSGLTSYAKIDQLFSAAQSDRDVRGIAMEYDTPGGEVSGLFTATDRLMAARGGKPVWAYVNESAYSAGYALASTADKIYLPATGGLAHIGAVMMHVDQSKRDASQGYSYTFIQSGDRKTDGNSHAPLSDAALGNLQDEIHRLRGMFADHVDTARGLEPGTAYDTQAATFHGEAAVTAGLADGVASFRDFIGMLEADVAAPDTTAAFSTTARRAGFTKETPMSQETPAADLAKTIDPAPFIAQGHTAGAQAERSRIAAILGSEEANGREAMAKTFALETDLDAATAQKLLAKSPLEAQAAAAGSEFAAAMAKVQNPKVGADVTQEVADTPEAQAAALALQVINAGQMSAKKGA